MGKFFVLFAFLLAATETLAGQPKLTIACRVGTQANVAPAGVCVASLPSCADILNGTGMGTGAVKGLVDQVKFMLSWKIYGYYQGYDLDLNKSTFNSDGTFSRVGGKLDNPICSVVGHTLKVTSANKTIVSGSVRGFKISDAEIVTQHNGSLQSSCGESPNFKRGGRDVKIDFPDSSKNRWAAYIRGAYPWYIRKAASDVLKQLNVSKLENLNSLFQESMSSQAVGDIINQMSSLDENTQKLSQVERQNCTLPNPSASLECDKLTVTDPAQRLCTLQKSRKIFYNGAFTNLIVYEIMLRAQKAYDQEVKDTILHMNSDSFVKKCQSFASDLGFSINHLVYSASAAACISGAYEETSENNWHCSHGPRLQERSILRKECFSGGTASGERGAWAMVYPRIDDPSKNYYQAGIYRQTSPKYLFNLKSQGALNDSFTVNAGFAGLIESKIRKHCGQNSISAENDCDKIQIPSKPEGVQ